MLPRRHRLTDGDVFAATVRRGRRRRSGPLVAHVWTDPNGGAPRFGLIVSKKVGNSVTRHRVSRVLRHAAAPLLADLPAGTVVVVRALPGAGHRDERLAADVAALIAPVGTRPGAVDRARS